MPINTLKTYNNINVAADAASMSGKFSKARPIAMKIGLCPKTIRRWSNLGYITRFKLSDRISLYSEKEIYEYIEAAKLGVSKKVL